MLGIITIIASILLAIVLFPFFVITITNPIAWVIGAMTVVAIEFYKNKKQ